jgi:hypothetical protein
MKGVLIVLMDVFICGLLNYWGFLILKIASENTPSAGFAEIFWIFNSVLLLGYLLVSYSIPTLILSIFHFAFLLGSIFYFREIDLLTPILIQILLLLLFLFLVKQKERAHRLKPIVFVVLFIWLVVMRSLV